MNSFNIVSIEEPTDLVKKSLNKKVFIRCRGDRELIGYLHVNFLSSQLIIQAFDKHFNMMLSQVEEVYIK